MTVRLTYDDGTHVPDDCKGGYGLALERLVGVVLGADDDGDVDLRQQLCDGPVENLGYTPDANEQPLTVKPEFDGWVDVGDGEGNDAIYHNYKLMATIAWSARGFWHATCHLADGRGVLHSMGANHEMECETWRGQPY